jgi:hypothetical protein
VNKVAFCTISSANYFPFAKTMLRSLRDMHPKSDLFYLLVDQHNDEIYTHTNFRTIDLNELHIPDQIQMAFAYDIVEMNTAVKPFLFNYLLQKGYSKVIYIDPDIYIYNKLDLAIKSLDKHSIVLTPHSLSPAQPASSFNGKVQWEQNMTVTGIFNLGFIGISNSPNTLKFLEWWQNRCKYLCYIEQIVGLFVDQKWAELAIAFWDDVFILHDPGYNVSIWNLHERTVQNKIVNKTHDLIFYHFSSIDLNNDSILSKHDINITIQHHPELKELFANYKAYVRQNDYDKYKSLKYAFGYFRDGKAIDILDRRLYANAANSSWNPFSCTRREFYNELKLQKNTSSKKKHGILFTLGGFLAYVLFRIIGSAKYRKLMMYGAKTIQLRAHTFLIR